VPLFWIVHSVDGSPEVFLVDAGDQITARLKALLAGHQGEFAEIHQLDTNTAKRVPERMRRRPLGQREAEAFLKAVAGEG
jgi:hypothetical protein